MLAVHLHHSFCRSLAGRVKVCYEYDDTHGINEERLAVARNCLLLDCDCYCNKLDTDLRCMDNVMTRE